MTTPVVNVGGVRRENGHLETCNTKPDKNENNWPNFWQGLYAYAHKRGDELKELYFKDQIRI